MKNRLFATFLTLTAIPFLANETSTNAELAAYLKNAKIHVQNILHNINEESTILEEEYSSQLYKETTNIWHELSTLLPMEIILAQTDCSFNFTHDELERLTQQSEDEILINLMNVCIPVGAMLCNGLQKDQEQAIKAIFKKHGKDDSKSAEETLNDFFGTEENWEIGMMIDMTRFINYLLPKIDTKIAELETQQ